MRTVEEALKDPSGHALPCISQFPDADFGEESRGMLACRLLPMLGVFRNDLIVGADDTLT